MPTRDLLGLGRAITLRQRLLALIAVAVLPAAADPSILLFFAIGQIPMFVGPFVLRPVYRRMTGG